MHVQAGKRINGHSPAGDPNLGAPGSSHGFVPGSCTDLSGFPGRYLRGRGRFVGHERNGVGDEHGNWRDRGDGRSARDAAQAGGDDEARARRASCPGARARCRSSSPRRSTTSILPRGAPATARSSNEYFDAYGAILFRGFPLDGPPDFEAVASAIVRRSVRRLRRSARRSRGARIYGTTPVPARTR